MNADNAKLLRYIFQHGILVILLILAVLFLIFITAFELRHDREVDATEIPLAYRSILPLQQQTPSPQPKVKESSIASNDPRLEDDEPEDIELSDTLFYKLLPEVQSYLQAHPETGLLQSVSDAIPDGNGYVQEVHADSAAYRFTVKNDTITRAHIIWQRPPDPIEPEDPPLPRDGKPTLDHFKKIQIGDTADKVWKIMGTGGAVVLEQNGLRVVEWNRGYASMDIQYKCQEHTEWKVSQKSQYGLKPYQPPRPPKPVPRSLNLDERRIENRHAREETTRIKLYTSADVYGR